MVCAVYIYIFLCTVLSDTVHCNQNGAGHQTINAPSMPCRGASGPCKRSLAFMPQDWELTDKIVEICINGKLSVQEPSEY